MKMPEQIIEDEYKKYKDDISIATKCQNTEGSPCCGCKNEFGDKEQCSEHCLRLGAFQYNREYRHLPYYQKPVTLPQIANKTGETPKTVKPATPKTTPWKRAMPKKQKKPTMVVQKPKTSWKPVPLTYAEKMKIIRGTTVCLGCGRDAKKYPLRRGLCLAKCSGAWRDGRITHSVLGVWKKMTKEEVHEARWGRYDECLIERCPHIGNRRGLCPGHYKEWYDDKILHPEFGVWFPKSKKKEGKRMSEEPVKYEINRKRTEKDGITPEIMEKVGNDVLDRMISHSILLDFKNYQEIYNELKAQVKLSKLPLAHVLFNLLSLGIMTAHEEEKRRNAEAK